MQRHKIALVRRERLVNFSFWSGYRRMERRVNKDSIPFRSLSHQSLLLLLAGEGFVQVVNDFGDGGSRSKEFANTHFI